ncbi:DUF2231 domain-containing protein [Desulforhopalus sp. IMCC35007]|uniref:DUF2231 domain-containing protein n=1 Tax=Desulforhopalus sp. IMCC35007 TaxID=2569543 RepID=UPI0010ADF199|nr:DUF2231 domain-containing protein [Desulforhopalus sp. IMCC35007]TKB06468.1 hypothetical protein FCL48_20985 [Desulforhopalus sp. IMCC35007]
MTEFIFSTLEAIGFAHPLHPALTHIPMGMVIGCFFFGLVAFVTRKAVFLKTSLHCSVLALIFIIPTIFAGYLDWQQFFGGTMSIFITIKIVLAIVLTLLLAYSIRENIQGAGVGKMFLLYTLCLACAGGLGFSGGEIIYGG